MSAASFKEAGNKHLQAGQFDEAIKAYTEAIKLNPNDHVFFSNRSAAYLSKGDATKALEDGAKCIEINSTWAKGYSRKGAALHALKRYDEAVETYNLGLSVAPGDSGLENGLKEVQKARDAAGPAGGGLFGPQMLAKLFGHPKFGPKLADPAFMAKLQLANKNPQLIMSDPELMEVFQAVLGGFGGAGGEESEEPSPFKSSPAPQPKKEPTPEPEPEIPLTEEERVEKEKKDKAVAAKERGNTHYKNKQFAEAIAAYDEAISTDPSNLMFLNNKAAVFIEMNECEKAIELCNDILEQAKTNKLSYDDRAKVYQRIAGAHLKKNDLAAGIAAYQKSQLEKPDKAIERKIKNLELDLKKQQQQAYLSPELAAEAKERGNAAFREGKFPEAIKEYEDAVKRDPANPSYHNNLAAAYQKMGLFNDAKRSVEKAIEIDRNYVKAWAKKGDIEFFMKEYHKSMDSYRAGLQIEPDNSLCKQGLQKTVAKIQEANMDGSVDKERQQHAMADPEIQAILSDPMVRQVLTDFQENPKYAQKAMNDPVMRAKIEKLISAGIIQVK